MTEDDMIKGARTTHFLRCRHYGFIHTEPCDACSEVTGDIVILRNSYREVGRYRLVKEGPHNWFEWMEEGEP